jgi:hypothetical protein
MQMLIAVAAIDDLTQRAHSNARPSYRRTLKPVQLVETNTVAPCGQLRDGSPELLTIVATDASCHYCI